MTSGNGKIFNKIGRKTAEVEAPWCHNGLRMTFSGRGTTPYHRRQEVNRKWSSAAAFCAGVGGLRCAIVMLSFGAVVVKCFVCALISCRGVAVFKRSLWMEDESLGEWLEGVAGPIDLDICRAVQSAGGRSPT